MRENRTYGLKRGYVRNFIPDGSTLPSSRLAGQVPRSIIEIIHPNLLIVKNVNR
jgi:hypothetical protein